MFTSGLSLEGARLGLLRSRGSQSNPQEGLSGGGGLVPLRSVRRCGLEPHTSPESVVLLARSSADACVPALLLAPAALFLDGMSMADPSFVAPQLACVVPVMWQSPLALEC